MASVDWYATLYKACMYASGIAFLLGFFTEKTTSYGAYLAGYSVLTLGIMMLLVVLFARLDIAHSSLTQLAYSILSTSGPFVLMLGVLTFVLYNLVAFQRTIVQGHVAPSYYSFSNLVVILLMVQLYMVIQHLNSGRPGLPRVTTSVLYLLGTVTGMCAVLLHTVLKYYSTDGFCDQTQCST